MNHEEALAEARKRWGVEAWAWEWNGRIFCVGTGREYPGTTVQCNSSWEAAFADADRREAARRVA